ncbi:BRISC and BRCA1-A complex member 1 isoform X1 [Haemorhous mexicanus]|uniref:BRISC and BRCA1-A complex member 1 isoform X1 n=1 Tax=Haemorhous mexicanus TaxID=30427 RepID=UPI0028BDCA19|nr:BRISC and BRCA1-A complex member 1 isoform X1 [Haemorhous mexicanus]
MDTSEPGSAAEDEEEKVPEVRPRTRSNPEGAEDRAPSGPGSAGNRGEAPGNRGEAPGNRGEAPGNRSEGEGEAASAGHSPPGQPGTAWHGPGSGQHGQHGEVTVRTPRVNCPEKVIICLDLAEEMAVPKLESFNGCRSNALTVAQKMIEMFVRTKHKIDKSHEFALVVVNNDATWLSGFTSDPREVCSCLYDLDTVVCQSFNLDGLFNLIQQKVELPVTDNVQTIPVPVPVPMAVPWLSCPCPHGCPLSVPSVSPLCPSQQKVELPVTDNVPVPMAVPWLSCPCPHGCPLAVPMAVPSVSPRCPLSVPSVSQPAEGGAAGDRQCPDHPCPLAVPWLSPGCPHGCPLSVPSVPASRRWSCR